MKKEDYFYIGKVTRRTGTKGEIAIELDCDHPNAYIKVDQLVLGLFEKLIPFTVEKIKIQGDAAIAKLKEISTPEEASMYHQADVYLDLKWLPKLTGTEFYFHEIIGFDAIDSTTGFIGKIIKVHELPMYGVAEVINKGPEIMVPLHADFIAGIDRENKTMTFNLPEGFVALYENG
ncbi:MAG: 16S rRNA processing protein RimM [Bacteroidetes bacterium]|nr:16S rRNA processing protein RimM [Bacteroidota bacterium]